jgi:hypothetical protein
MCGLLRRLLVFAFIVQCLERHSTPPGWVGVCFVLVFLSVVLAAGSRPVPFRTRKLSLPAPMVLHLGGCGRVGRRRHCFLCGVWLQQSLWLLWSHTTFFMRVSGWVCGGAPPRGRRAAVVREGRSIVSSGRRPILLEAGGPLPGGSAGAIVVFDGPGRSPQDRRGSVCFVRRHPLRSDRPDGTTGGAHGFGSATDWVRIAVRVF